jgi:Protein of unknown function (DUF721).
MQSEQSRSLLARVSALGRLEKFVLTLLPARFQNTVKVANLRDNTLIIYARTPQSVLYLETQKKALLASLKEKLTRLEHLSIVRTDCAFPVQTSTSSQDKKNVPPELTLLLEQLKDD